MWSSAGRSRASVCSWNVLELWASDPFRQARNWYVRSGRGCADAGDEDGRRAGCDGCCRFGAGRLDWLVGGSGDDSAVRRHLPRTGVGACLVRGQSARVAGVRPITRARFQPSRQTGTEAPCSKNETHGPSRRWNVCSRRSVCCQATRPCTR
jgi:hypothetical protein